MVENQTGKKLKKLRTDSGLEFCNQRFDKYCAEEGVMRHRIVRLTPQQNSLAERMNKTLMEKGEVHACSNKASQVTVGRNTLNSLLPGQP